MVLIGAAILPHSSLILDPTLEDLPAGAEELHVAAKAETIHVLRVQDLGFPDPLPL